MSDIFSPRHPNPDRKRGLSHRPAGYLYHDERESTLRESGRVRCRQCGFPCHTGRDARGTGEGNDYSSATLGMRWGFPWGDSGWGDLPVDATISGGCAFCGSFNFD